MTTRKLVAFALAALVFTTAAEAVTIDMVPVSNPGNAPDTRYHGISVGSVANAYQIGKYEVTAGQYTEFLNAVAQADPNELYHTAMGDPINSLGANIQRTGSAPSYSYSVAADWADRPVNWVSFWDAARFANWLHNGQPTGAQGPGTTEDGAYHDVGNQSLFGRNAGARFFIPTENEWYKAAYHNKSAGLAAGYFDYPTGTDAEPGNNVNETTNAGDNANFSLFHGGNGAIGSPYYRTAAGEFQLSESAYGTFDQGGNVWEWNETARNPLHRGQRGGSFDITSNTLHAAYFFCDFYPSFEANALGFRVASMVIPAIPGDFNEDGIVDAADYVVWRKSGTPEQYDEWRANFGRSAAAASELASEAPVPEPASLQLLTIAALAFGALHRKSVHH